MQYLLSKEELDALTKAATTDRSSELAKLREEWIEALVQAMKGQPFSGSSHSLDPMREFRLWVHAVSEKATAAVMPAKAPDNVVKLC